MGSELKSSLALKEKDYDEIAKDKSYVNECLFESQQKSKDLESKLGTVSTELVEERKVVEQEKDKLSKLETELQTEKDQKEKLISSLANERSELGEVRGKL